MTEPPQDDLQFDEAEYDQKTGSGRRDCVSCGTTLSSQYFVAKDQVVCESCGVQLANIGPAGSGPGRFVKAAVLGLIGGAIGAGIYFGILKLTGYEIGLVAIVVGWLVGGGVRMGCAGRGGWLYQALAIVITYLAIVATYVPFIMTEFDAGYLPQQAADSAQVAKITVTRDQSIVLNGDIVAAGQLDAELGQLAEETGEVWYHREGMGSEASGPAGDQVFEVLFQHGLPVYTFSDRDFQQPELWSEAVARSDPVQKLVAWLTLIVLAAMAPFLTLPGNIIGLLIIGFALFEAWRINKRVEIEITGPYQISELRGQ